MVLWGRRKLAALEKEFKAAIDKDRAEHAESVRELEAENDQLRHEAVREREGRDGIVVLLNDSLRGKDVVQAQLVATREQLGALRASFEWLTTHVTRVEVERAELLARVLGVQFTAMQIELPRSSTAPPTPGNASAQVHGVPLADNYSDTVPGTQVATSMFEDPGDDEAAKMGVKHDTLGNVSYQAP